MSKPRKRALTPQQALTRRKGRFTTRLTKDRRLRGLDFCVALNILDRVGVDSPVAWPKEETIANDLGCCVKSVSRAVNALIKCGWFENERRGRGKGVSNRYRPMWDNRTDLSRSKVENRTSKSREQDNPVPNNKTNLSHESSQEAYLESIGGGHAALPPNGGGAPLKPHIGNASLGASSICLQESVSLKSSPPFPTRLPSLKAPDGISKADKNEAFARSKLAGSLGWDVLIAADDVEDGNHLSAVENCRREAERLGVSWKPPATGAPKEPVARPTRIKPSLETLQKKGITPDVALAQLVGRAQAAA